MNNTQDTAAQDTAVARLERQGWRETHRDDDTVYLAKRDRKLRGLTHYCQVSLDGTVEGDTT
jgi:hypothetical protein